MSLIKAFASFYVIDQSAVISRIVRKIETCTIASDKPVTMKSFCRRDCVIKLIKQFLESLFLYLVATLDHSRRKREIFFSKLIKKLCCNVISTCNHREQHGLFKRDFLFPGEIRSRIGQKLIPSLQQG